MILFQSTTECHGCHNANTPNWHSVAPLIIALLINDYWSTPSMRVSPDGFGAGSGTPVSTPPVSVIPAGSWVCGGATGTSAPPIKVTAPGGAGGGGGGDTGKSTGNGAAASGGRATSSDSLAFSWLRNFNRALPSSGATTITVAPVLGSRAAPTAAPTLPSVSGKSAWNTDAPEPLNTCSMLPSFGPGAVMMLSRPAPPRLPAATLTPPRPLES